MSDVMLRTVVKERLANWKSFRDQLPKQVIGRSLADLKDNWNGTLSPVNSQRLAKIAVGKLDTPQFIILTGPPGTGKTSLAVSLSKNLFASGKYSSLQYITGPDLLWQLSYGNTDSKVPPVKRYINSGILLLDDIGIADANITATRREGMWNIVNSRWGRGSKAVTIITTNVSVNPGKQQGANTLADIFGESAWDRIRDHSIVIPFEGKSLRRSR